MNKKVFSDSIGKYIKTMIDLRFEKDEKHAVDIYKDMLSFTRNIPQSSLFTLRQRQEIAIHITQIILYNEKSLLDAYKENYSSKYVYLSKKKGSK